MEYTLEHYDLTITADSGNKCRIKLVPAVGKAIEKERRKIYIIHFNQVILYVGEANTSIKTRLQRGCTSFNYFTVTGIARGGYKGYKWLSSDNSQRSLKVSVAVFGSENDADEKRSIIEAIEGELVYLIRNKTGAWPLFQNEIHFSNVKEAIDTAKGIFNHIFEENQGEF